jgi:hypothetical protein
MYLYVCISEEVCIYVLICICMCVYIRVSDRSHADLFVSSMHICVCLRKYIQKVYMYGHTYIYTYMEDGPRAYLFKAFQYAAGKDWAYISTYTHRHICTHIQTYVRAHQVGYMHSCGVQCCAGRDSVGNVSTQCSFTGPERVPSVSSCTGTISPREFMYVCINVWVYLCMYIFMYFSNQCSFAVPKQSLFCVLSVYLLQRMCIYVCAIFYSCIWELGATLQDPKECSLYTSIHRQVTFDRKQKCLYMHVNTLIHTCIH